MMSRNKTQKGDLRSRIKHENTQLGGGTEMGGKPNSFGLQNAFNPQATQQQQKPPSSSKAAKKTYGAGLIPIPGLEPSGSQDGVEMLASSSYGSGMGGSAAPPPSSHHQHSQSIQQSHLQAQRQLGVGPSFVSLTPSDSISNFEGRTGHQQYAHGHAPSMSSSAGTMQQGGDFFEPSSNSTASFAQGLADDPQHANAPLRPARSMRRPQRMSVIGAPLEAGAGGMRPPPRNPSYNLMTSSVDDRRRGGSSFDSTLVGDAEGARRSESAQGMSETSMRTPRSADRHAQSARLMAQVNNVHESGRETPGSGASEDEDAVFDRPSPGFALSQPLSSPVLGSLTQEKSPAALGNVLSALSQAGRKQGQSRILRGTTAEEESRRRQSERKVHAARSREVRPLDAYVDRNDEKAFREIGAVLRKAKAEWDFVVDDDFNSVALAFSLLDESSLGGNRADFDEMKRLIERALQGTVDDHYESFATAISLHNNVLSSLGSAQNGVSGARRRLREAREALGAKRADLVQLWHRSQAVKENLRLLDAIDNLKSIPDRLESLMAEKQFLDAVNLLARALKTCEKAEICEVGATGDLRAYLKGQEQAMFDILIEELHNHLYLKSYFCDARWKAYTRGQTTLPNVEFGREYDIDEDGSKEGLNGAGAETNDGEGASGAQSTARKTAKQDDTNLKLFRYLKSLSVRPAPDANWNSGDLNDLNISSQAAGAGNGEGAAMMTTSNSVDSISGPSKGTDASNYHFQQQNPETDSFLYIEMLLEALAKLDKLKLTQDVIIQRLPTELHQLVDATIDEVDARSEMNRRSSVAAQIRPESLLLASSSALARSFAENARNSFRSSYNGGVGQAALANFSAMRLSTLESNQVERDCETMRDLFWTMFSKLDAVLQGHRVVFEVVTKISSRTASATYKAVKLGKPSSLTDVWRPIQTEVRSLLHEHLVDDETEGTSARRNAIISINEVLRQGSFQRDRSKSLFRLIADAAPKPGVNLSRKDFAPLRRHEEALTNALRASVPGLVGSTDGIGSAAIFQQQPSHTIATTRSAFAGEGAGHKLLVKPDAFNISVLFQPALAFIERVKVLLPPEAAGRAGGESEGSSTASSGFSRFLDEFVHDVFLSQLEEKVQSLFSTAVSGPDAFQEDAIHKTRTLGRPIVRSVANVIVLIDSLYAMLTTTPFHRQSYSLLIIQTVVQYYQRCHERFQDLISHDTSAPSLQTNSRGAGASPSPSGTVSLASMWAQRPELASCLTELISDGCTMARAKQLADLEISLELQLSQALLTSRAGGKGKPPTNSGSAISLRDLTTSRKKLVALGNLQHSLLWFYEHIQKLKASTSDDVSDVQGAPVARLSIISTVPSRLKPNRPDSKEDDEGGETALLLPLSAAMVPRFRALPNTFKHLAHLILFTLRLEVRARTIHHLDLAINEGNYLVEDAVLEPDPHIVDLNAELASLDDIFADTVLPKYHRFIFSGLASLMDQILCRAIRKIRFINRHGLTKMIRNIMALQQNLRNIVVVNETIGGAQDTRATEATDKGGESQSSSGHKDDVQHAAFSTVLNVDGFERSRKLWELVGKEPDAFFASIRSTGAQHSFYDYEAALNLILGLENGEASQTATATVVSPTSLGSAMAGQGPPPPPNATIRPGTSEHARDLPRQKVDEYLIELHEVAGEAM